APLKPTQPALAQEIAFPWRSEMVMMVLLKVDWMWATPRLTPRLTFLRVVLAFDFVLRAISDTPYLRPRPATVLRTPRRVLALVRVLCPRTGKPRRWRMPR